MQWQDVSSSEKFLNANQETQQKIKQAFFDRYVMPKAKTNGLDVEDVQSSFFLKVDGRPEIKQTPEGDALASQNDEFLSKVATPEKLLEWRGKGAIGAGEAFTKLNKWEMLPYLNAKATWESVSVLRDINRHQDGEVLTGQEKTRVSEYVEDMLEIQARGYSVGGGIMTGVLQMPAFAVEFMTAGGLTSGIKFGAKKAAQTGIKGAVTRAATGAAQLATQAAKRTALSPHRVVDQYAQTKINDQIALTDKGVKIYENADSSPAKTALKAFGDVWVEMLSEQTGDVLLAPMFSKVKRAVGRTLPDKLVKQLNKAVEETTNLPVATAVKKMGFDGVLEEIGEERIGDILRTTLDLDQEEGYSADQFIAAAIPDADQFLIEAGVIGMWGGASRAVQIGAAKLAKRGLPKSDIEGVLNSMSETERETLAFGAESVEDAQTEQAYIETRDSLKQNMVDAGIQEEDATAMVSLIDARVMAVSDALGETKVDVVNRWGLKFQSERLDDFTAEREAKEERDAVQSMASEETMTDQEFVKPDDVPFQMDEDKTKRGAIKIGKGETIISLFEGADKSTVLHELGHLFLRDVEHYANTTDNANIKGQMQDIRSWLGNDGGAFTIEQQEQFARGFEQYLRTGNAPTSQLKDAFAKFKEWLLSIYTSAKMLNVEVPPSVSRLFDSMLMTEKQKQDTGFYEPLDEFEVFFQSARFAFSELSDAQMILDRIEYILDAGQDMTDEDIKDIRASIANLRKINPKKSVSKKSVKDDLDALEAVLQDRDKIAKAQIKRAERTVAKQKRELEALAPVPESQYEAMLNMTQTESEALKSKGINIKNGDNLMRKIFMPISTRLGDIDQKLKHTMRRFEFNVNIRKNADMEKVVGFFEKVRTLSETDFKRLDFAMKNIDLAEIDRIAKKHGMIKDVRAVRELLDDIRKRAIAVGIDVNLIENYFPRSVNNPDAYLSWLRGSDNWTYIERQLKEAKLDDATNIEKAEFVNLMLARYDIKEFKERIFKSTKQTAQRKFTRITPEMNLFYKDSFQAVLNYIGSMNNLIEAKKFWGIDKLGDSSIGHIIENMITDKTLTVDQEEELKNILRARFGQIGTRGFIRTYKNLSYIYTMGSISSAITQIGDLGLSLYKNGFYNTRQGFTKSLTSQDKITKEDLGITGIAQEFSDETKTKNAVKKVFRLVGLEFMDNLGKETTINAALLRLQESAKSPNARFNRYLQDVFGKESGKVLQDLKDGNASENVRYLLFSELSDLQPISLSEMPEQYLVGGNARLFYMLKTYTIKLFDVYRNDVFKKINSGDDEEVKEGLKNLLKLTASLAITGMTADAIKDVLFGRDMDISDLVFDNILKLAGLSKWQIYKSRSEGLFSTLLQSILPPIPLIDDVYKDISAVVMNKKGRDIEDFRTWKGVPLVGKLYYWWFGGGKDTK